MTLLMRVGGEESFHLYTGNFRENYTARAPALRQPKWHSPAMGANNLLPERLCTVRVTCEHIILNESLLTQHLYTLDWT